MPNAVNLLENPWLGRSYTLVGLLLFYSIEMQSNWTLNMYLYPHISFALKLKEVSFGNGFQLIQTHNWSKFGEEVIVEYLVQNKESSCTHSYPKSRENHRRWSRKNVSAGGQRGGLQQSSAYVTAVATMNPQKWWLFPQDLHSIGHIKMDRPGAKDTSSYPKE